MKTTFLIALAVLAAATLLGQSAEAPVDFNQARRLMEKQQGGGVLTPDEETCLKRARAEHKAQQRGQDGVDWRKAQELFQREQRGEKLSEPDQKYLDHAKEVRRRDGNTGDGRGAQGVQRRAPESLKPLTDMSAEDRYEGEDGGLYGKGSNEPPESLRKAATEALKQIQPLDAEGRPSDSGKVVLVSISMSNATQEFSVFKGIADQDPRMSDKLAIVDCAQGGQTMAAWAQPEGRPWPEAMSRLQKAGVTAQQVQVTWVKLANAGPSGSKADHLSILESDTARVLHLLKQRFPNLRIAYLGSRIYAGHASTGLNPEPYAYEGAFAVRHLIQKQMEGDPDLASERPPAALGALPVGGRREGPQARRPEMAQGGLCRRRHSPVRKRPGEGRQAASGVLREQSVRAKLVRPLTTARLTRP